MISFFEPLEGYALCEYPGTETTDGGIVIPEAAQQEEEGEAIKMKVVKVGPGEQRDGQRRDVPIEPGKVYYFIFPSYSLGAKITLGGKKYVIVQSKFVCGKAEV